MNKSMLILAVIGTETTYEHLAMRTGISPMLLGGFVYHLMRRGFITKTRACRTKPAVFSITPAGREQLHTPRRRSVIRRPAAVVEAAVTSTHPLHAIWQPCTEES